MTTGVGAMEQSTTYLITQFVIAAGAVTVCILAIWTERIRSYASRRRLELRLHDPRVDLTWCRNGAQSNWCPCPAQSHDSADVVLRES
jgi:hypothetical protein